MASYYKVLLASQPRPFGDTGECLATTKTWKLFRVDSAAPVATWSDSPAKAVDVAMGKTAMAAEVLENDPQLQVIVSDVKQKMTKRISEMQADLRLMRATTSK